MKINCFIKYHSIFAPLSPQGHSTDICSSYDGSWDIQIFNKWSFSALTAAFKEPWSSAIQKGAQWWFCFSSLSCLLTPCRAKGKHLQYVCIKQSNRQANTAGYYIFDTRLLSSSLWRHFLTHLHLPALILHIILCFYLMQNVMSVAWITTQTLQCIHYKSSLNHPVFSSQ